MSTVVKDISNTFEDMVRNVNTTLGLVIGVAIFFFMLPVLLQITGLIKAITGK
jgi:hypothetical protein